MRLPLVMSLLLLAVPMQAAVAAGASGIVLAQKKKNAKAPAKAASVTPAKAGETKAAGGMLGWWSARSDMGQKLLLGGVGGVVGGLGLSVLGMNVANNAISDREALMSQRELTSDERAEIGNLEGTTSTGTLLHYLGFGVSGAALVAAAVGGLL